MFRKLTLVWLFTLFIVLSAVGIQAQNATAEPSDQSLFLTFIPNIQFAPVYVGIEKGYFSAQGIHLSVEYGEEPVGLDLIAAGQREFGVISGEEVIKARANGRPVVSVYEWFQQYPIGIVVPEGSGIESVSDLAGRKVGIPGRFGASYNGLVAVLAANGMVESDIELEPIGFNAPDIFCIGQVEAAVVYINNEPLQIENRITAGNCNEYTGIRVFPVATAVDLVSNTLVTNEETIANNPERVQAMVTAFDQALRDTINNPFEAYLLSTAQVENLPSSTDFRTALEEISAEQALFLADDPSRELIGQQRETLFNTLAEQFDADALIQMRVLLNSIQLWDAEQLGFGALYSWELTQEILIIMGFIDTPIDLEAAFTNDYLSLAVG